MSCLLCECVPMLVATTSLAEARRHAKGRRPPKGPWPYPRQKGHSKHRDSGTRQSSPPPWNWQKCRDKSTTMVGAHAGRGGHTIHAINTHSIACCPCSLVRRTMPLVRQPLRKGSTTADQHGGCGCLLNFSRRKKSQNQCRSKGASHTTQGGVVLESHPSLSNRIYTYLPRASVKKYKGGRR